jgi:hypothetical protein
LGAGTPEMTMAELAKAESDLVEAAKTGGMTPVVPVNLNRYWQHHLEAAAATPRGALTIQQHQKMIRTAASTALHHEACDAANAACRQAEEQAKAPERAKALLHAVTLAANLPATTIQGSNQPLAASQTAQPPTAPNQSSTFASAAGYTTPGPARDTEQAKYQSHTSPAVHMAAAREDQAQSARAAATTVVAMASKQRLEAHAVESRRRKRRQGILFEDLHGGSTGWGVERVERADITRKKRGRELLRCRTIHTSCARCAKDAAETARNRLGEGAGSPLIQRGRGACSTARTAFRCLWGMCSGVLGLPAAGLTW